MGCSGGVQIVYREKKREKFVRDLGSVITNRPHLTSRRVDFWPTCWPFTPFGHKQNKNEMNEFSFQCLYTNEMIYDRCQSCKYWPFLPHPLIPGVLTQIRHCKGWRWGVMGGGVLAINNRRTRPLINWQRVTQKSKSGRVDLFKRSKEHVCDEAEGRENSHYEIIANLLALFI